jgi:hypothetical protein
LLDFLPESINKGMDGLWLSFQEWFAKKLDALTDS